MYDYKTCACDRAAWLISDERGAEQAFFAVSVCENEYSPNGFGWSFASYLKGAGGRWSEHDGGIYWDFKDAREFEDVIGDTVPFREFTYWEIDYGDFEAICLGGDAEREVGLLGERAVSGLVHKAKDQLFDVRITETLERTVQVKANNRDDAVARVQDGWKYETHVLGAEDFKAVRFKVMPQVRGREGR